MMREFLHEVRRMAAQIHAWILREFLGCFWMAWKKCVPSAAKWSAKMHNWKLMKNSRVIHACRLAEIGLCKKALGSKIHAQKIHAVGCVNFPEIGLLHPNAPSQPPTPHGGGGVGRGGWGTWGWVAWGGALGGLGTRRAPCAYATEIYLWVYMYTHVDTRPEMRKKWKCA